MFHHAPSFIFLIFFLTILSPVSPNQDLVTVQPFLVKSSPPATIPAFPEQSDFSGCPLDLPEDLFHGIKSACTGKKLHKGKCCPVLGAWLYSAYSTTALSRSIPSSAVRNATTPEEDMPLLPDDSETCVDGLEKSLRRRGIELASPNETCGVVDCYCGIRLHHLSCSEAFSVNGEGRLVGDESVDRLETDCLSVRNNNGDRFSPLSRCNKCLNSLYKIFLFLARRDPSSPSSFAVEISSSFVVVFIEPFRRRLHQTFPSSSSSSFAAVGFIEPCRCRIHRVPLSSSSSSFSVLFLVS